MSSILYRKTVNVHLMVHFFEKPGVHLIHPLGTMNIHPQSHIATRRVKRVLSDSSKFSP